LTLQSGKRRVKACAGEGEIVEGRGATLKRRENRDRGKKIRGHKRAALRRRGQKKKKEIRGR